MKLLFSLFCLLLCGNKIGAQSPPTNGVYLPIGIPLVPSGFDRNAPFSTDN